MAGWSRRLWRPVTVVCCAVLAIVSVAGATAASNGARSAEHAARASVRILQLNLCNSGIAHCYTGRSVNVAAALIRAELPDVVTLNEVCQGDVSTLDRALAGVTHDAVGSAFRAAVDRRAGGAVRCRNGQQYGIGVLARTPLPRRGYATYGGTYPAQGIRDPEERVWLCVHPVAGFDACTTHLASTSTTVALAQCRYLFDHVLPAMRERDDDPLMLLGADLNLWAGHSPGAGACVPPGYVRTDDGGSQHVVATSGFIVSVSRTIGMAGTTDHPALVVDLVRARG